MRCGGLETLKKAVIVIFSKKIFFGSENKCTFALT